MRIFLSYSHKNSSSLERLKVHFANLLRQGKISAWYDRDILAGDTIDQTINDELEKSDLVLLLVSPDFIASNYCFETEMEKALKLRAEGKLEVVPIIIEVCEWLEIDKLKQLKAVPKDGLAVSKWENPDEAYLDIVSEIRRLVEKKPNTLPTHDHNEKTVKDRPRAASQYKIKRSFNQIDRSEFRESAFSTIKNYFRCEIEELDKVKDIRTRFAERGDASFCVTLINAAYNNEATHLTVHSGEDAGHSIGDIYYSSAENAAKGTANGWMNISSDDYQQFLEADNFNARKGQKKLTPEAAAKLLWEDFIAQGGITDA